MISFRSARTGPVGRLARLVLLVALALALASIVDQGGVVALRESPLLDEPGLWILTGVMIVLFVHLVGELARALAGHRAAAPWRIVAVVAVAVALAVAAAAGPIDPGRAWGTPLADTVWWFDVVMLSETIVALALAIVRGTPGCEIGVWTELIHRARGDRTRSDPWILCLVGLDLVDEWEARRRPARPGSHPVRR